MKKEWSFLLVLICVACLPHSIKAQWPNVIDQISILRHYDSDHLYRIALPIGGIGTGTVSLGGRGELRDWEIMNIPAKGYSTVTPGNDAPFFAIYTKEKGGGTSDQSTFRAY